MISGIIKFVLFIIRIIVVGAGAFITFTAITAATHSVLIGLIVTIFVVGLIYKVIKFII